MCGRWVTGGTKDDDKMKNPTSRSLLVVALVAALLSFTSNAGAAPGDGSPDLDLGPFGPGLIDGSAPFDTTGNCGSSGETPGDDCGPSNHIVRSQDTVSYVWSVTADDFAPGDTELVDVVMEQTIAPSADADVAFVGVPAICTPPGGGGTTPPSEIVDNGDGTFTLICNLGIFTEGQQKSFSSVVKVAGTSLNGQTFTSTQQVYARDDQGGDRATPDSEAAILETISAAPAYDLSKGGWHNQDVATHDIGNGPEPGYVTYFNIRLAASRVSGIEALAMPFSFHDTVSAMHADGVTPYTEAEGFEFFILGCTPNPSGWGDEVWGSDSISTGVAYAPTGHVQDSGDCSYSRDAGGSAAGYTFTLDNADLSGTRYPTRTIGGTDLSAGPYYVINHRVQVFLPFRSIDIEDTTTNDVGAIHLYNVFENFDPDSVSGTSNFGPANEPIDNNDIGPTTFQLTIRGAFAKYAVGTANNAGHRTSWMPSQSGWQTGDGELEPGQFHASIVYYTNNGTLAHDQPESCDVFDNTTMQLTDAGNTGATTGKFAYVGNGNGIDPVDFVVEYAHYDFAGDSPISGGFDDTTTRYLGSWDAQRSVRCENAGSAGGPASWHTDPATVPGGVDAVNAVRARPLPGVQLLPGERLQLVVPLLTRDNFNGGPDAGTVIPEGTVMADFAMVRSDTYFQGWTGRNYQPSPENASADGDRATLVRLRARLEKRSITPAADIGNTGSTVAGNEIVWELLPALQSSATPPGTALNVTIVDVLPPDSTYNPTCTAARADGTPPDNIEPNTDRDGNAAPGYTRLTWNLGDRVANAAFTPIVICTDSNSLAPDGTSVVNYGEINADNVVNALSERSDEHTVILQQTGSMQLSKAVDASFDGLDQDQVYSLSWANFAATFEIDPPVVIDVFSFMSGSGDGVGSNSPRLPASNFTGSFELRGEPSITWLDDSVPGAGDPHATIGTWFYTADAPETVGYDPDNNTSNWCLEAAFGTPSCPTSFAGATAVKFISNYPLAQDGNPRQGMKASYTIDASNNTDGDLYTNRFTLDSTSLPAEQFLRSNNVSVEVAASSIGNYVWLDTNGDGIQDAVETGLGGVEVTLTWYGPDGVLGGGDDVVTTTTTAADGSYLFDNLHDGNYAVAVTDGLPGVVVASYDETGTADSASEVVGLSGGAFHETADFGYQATGPIGTASLGRSVWADVDGDGIQDAGEAGIAGATVTIVWHGPDGDVTYTVVTDDSGQWSLDNLPAGDYTVSLNKNTVAEGLVASTPDSVNVTLPDGGHKDVDIGLVQGASVGSTVWVDTDRDGKVDLGEAGIAGVTIELRDSDGVLVATTTTDSKGKYLFTDVVPGDYTLVLLPNTVPSQYKNVFTKDGNGDLVVAVTLAPGENLLDINYGYVPPQLAVTGSNSGRLVNTGLLFLVLGTAGVLLGRRRKLALTVA